MLLPVVDIFLNERRVQSYDSIEEFDCLLAVVNFRRSEGVHILIVRLELACLEELNCVLSQAHRCQLCQFIIIVESLFTLFDVFLKVVAALKHLLFVHEDRAQREPVILQSGKLLQIVNSFLMSVVPALLQLVPLLNCLVHGIYFEQLVLEPHLDIRERVGHGSLQVVEVPLQRNILRVFKEQLLLW